MSKKDVNRVEVVTPKKRISASITEWMIEWIGKEKIKEGRSFSGFVDRLLYEAIQSRRGYVKKVK